MQIDQRPRRDQSANADRAEDRDHDNELTRRFVKAHRPIGLIARMVIQYAGCYCNHIADDQESTDKGEDNSQNDVHEYRCLGLNLLELSIALFSASRQMDRCHFG